MWISCTVKKGSALHTRMSQAADVSGTVTVDGTTLALDGADGLRDRSGGIRPVGLPGPQPHLPAQVADHMDAVVLR